MTQHKHFMTQRSQWNDCKLETTNIEILPHVTET